jgi:protein phosphatase
MGIRLDWHGGSETGHVRSRNEDRWGVVPLGDHGGILFAVADGMGGQMGGEVASRVAVQSILREANAVIESESEMDPRALLDRLFRAAQVDLRREARHDQRLWRMGTTLTVLLARPDGVWFGHVGDSRLVWYRDGVLALVTRDHSAAWELVESGLLEPEQAERDPSGALLTRHLGADTDNPPDVSDRPLDIHPGDRFLLATDGLGKVLSMERIAHSLGHGPVREAVASLIEQTLAGGAPDNVTVVAAEISEAPELGVPGLAFDSFPYRWIEEAEID